MIIIIIYLKKEEYFVKEERMYLLRKVEDDFYSVIVFSDNIDFKELEKKIENYRDTKSGEIDDIIGYLEEEYNIDEIIDFDYISKNTMDIDNTIIYEEFYYDK
jgi:hypothetical protein